MLSAIVSLACLGFFLIQSIWAQEGGHDKQAHSKRCKIMEVKAHREMESDRKQSMKSRGRNTGLSEKPSLTPQGGPVVRSGENVTLLCSSERAFDQFHLLREGENLGRPLAGGRGPRGALQAEFPLGPGTPAHSGVCRCYGSFTRPPYVWSDPSDTLLLCVTGSTTSTFPSPMDPHTIEEARRPQGHSSQLHLLLRFSVAFIYTSILLAVLLCHWLPKNGVDNLSNLGYTTASFGFDVPTQDMEVYKNHRHPKSVDSLPFADVAIMEGEPKEDRTVNSEDLVAEDVIFAHLNHRSLSETLFTPAPLSPMHPSAESSIYEELIVNRGHAEP